MIAALIAATLAGAVLPQAASAATGPAGEVFALTNAERTDAGLRPLMSDPALDAAAAEWARHLAATCTFAHSSSAWRGSRVSATGWVATGENIAAGQSNATAVVTTWMGSSGHRANILDSRYTGLGVGYATGSCYRTYWVQIFGIGSPVKTLPGGVGDLTGDRRPDILARTSAGALTVYPGNATGGFAAPIVAIPAWGTRPFVALGDFSGDGIPDIGRVEPDGRLMMHAGSGKGAFRAAVQIGSGWGGFSRLIGGVDVSGDRLPDMLARTSAGELLLYRGNGRGGWLPGGGVKVGQGWQAIDPVFHAGDFDGDSRGDLIARKSDGTLWLYPTNGRGGFGTARRIGTGWSPVTAISAAGDFDGNGTQDVVARSSSGALLLYGGTGRGGFLSPRTIGTGWNAMAQIG